jgi:ADP-ribose pyrophosphatase YjhB (NUDIX family)
LKKATDGSQGPTTDSFTGPGDALQQQETEEEKIIRVTQETYGLEVRIVPVYGNVWEFTETGDHLSDGTV